MSTLLETLRRLKCAVDIQNFEEVLGNTNNLNRKLEEVHGVGKEFTTVAELWGKFSDLISNQQVCLFVWYHNLSTSSHWILILD